MDNLFYLFEQINLNLLNSWWITLLAGIVLCFFGFQLFQRSFFWFGVLVGGVFGYGIGSALYQLLGGVIGAGIMGLICGYLFRALIRVGVFLAGLVAGGLVGTTFFEQSLWVVPVILVSGILAAAFFRYFITVITALWGAILLTGSVAMLSHLSTDLPSLVVVAIELTLFAGGLAFQFLHMREAAKPVEWK